MKRIFIDLKFIFLIIIYLFTTKSLYCKEILPKGYLLFVSLETYEVSKYGAISTPIEGEKIFEYFSKYDYPSKGIVYLPIFFSEKDIKAHQLIAEYAKKYNVDLWGSSFKLMSRIRAFGNINDEYQAYTMKEDGSIVPAYLYSGTPLFDVLNEKAMDWFIDKYKNQYLIPMKGLLKGFVFDEDVLIYLDKSRENKNNFSFNYMSNPTYSDAVLSRWKNYCISHNVRYNNKIVDKFPVHKKDMVIKGNGKTEYYPGYNVPSEILVGEKFINIHKSTGVWEQWFEFLSEAFMENWIKKIAKAVNDVNKNNDKWYGIMYIGFFPWMLSYEQIKTDIRVPKIQNWGVWGTQRGFSLEKLSTCEDIDYLVFESYPPTSANISEFIDEFNNIVKDKNKIIGFALHRDDHGYPTMEEENKRWELIWKYQPYFIVRYPLKRILPDDPNFSEEKEKYFLENLKAYREKIIKN